ncbi:hypothetical protein H0X06_06195 [Candidatus Dependentiae bacterium]|nr:hypothetical protein [Candidatus Dependentiae bacterium]
MKKINFFLVGVLLVNLLGCFSCKEHLSHSIPQTTHKVIPLNGEETAQLTSSLYKELGPRIGVHLVDPNVVIALAGLRGGGSITLHGLTDEEKLKLKKVNENFQKFGIKFVVHEDVKDEIAVISVLNLKGFEYASRLSKFPFMKPFDSSTGFEGLEGWQNEMYSEVKKYFKDKKYTKKRPLGDTLGHFFGGLMLGYPDQALLDFLADYTTNSSRSKLSYHSIPYSDYYENAQPNFGYFREHENEESIVRTRKSWGNLLKRFYTSSLYKSLAKDPMFIQTRDSEDDAHHEWFKRKR